jgi:beta-barrel assembly-enhancing protease
MRSTSVQTEWLGYYLDGRTAARQAATIRLMQSGLEVTPENGLRLWWPYHEIRQSQGFYAGELIRFERGQEFPEVLLVSDLAFLTALRRIGAERVAHVHDPALRRNRAILTLVGGLAIIAVATALFLWGIPALAAVLSAYIPISWEERLGEAVIKEVASPGKRCHDATRIRRIEQIITTLTAPPLSSPYTFRIMVVNDRRVNAFAAPGGYIVLFRGLIERTQSAAELAGVLAHEMQHIIRRHSTRALLQHASTGFLVGALSNTPTGSTSSSLEMARMLGELRYSRGHEEEADGEGMRMLIAAKIDPQGMIRFFESLQHDGADVQGLLTYRSTHPALDDRIGRLKSLAHSAPTTPRQLFDDYDWNEMHKICLSPNR